MSTPPLRIGDASPGGRDGPVTVLLAEDDPGLRWIFGETLRAAGFAVVAAADGAEALELARSHAGPIGMLVSDVRMPRVGGFELAALLRAERPGVKVLFVSGHADRAPCGSPLLAKPFWPAELSAAVLALLGEP
jgi:two-component system cell cycle sensor histidine kinase/response regulator CckA